ncbi:unnamed protein product [Ostreobium quekettii]|uniref:Uncharacterized protein n=1 Tax=Ostreobium quekettii TaxID=121088 RepID=A0A8S1INX0_9CHLO|nr:unnamed protein product [Ostreobium quekettii]
MSGEIPSTMCVGKCVFNSSQQAWVGDAQRLSTASNIPDINVHEACHISADTVDSGVGFSVICCRFASVRRNGWMRQIAWSEMGTTCMLAAEWHLNCGAAVWVDTKG